MRARRQIQLATLVREHRESLEEIVTELVERGEPITEFDARLICEAGSVRLSQVEEALRNDALRFGRGRLHAWTKPRIGVLRHYEPKPILVPARYVPEARPSRHRPSRS